MPGLLSHCMQQAVDMLRLEHRSPWSEARSGANLQLPWLYLLYTTQGLTMHQHVAHGAPALESDRLICARNARLGGPRQYMFPESRIGELWVNLCLQSSQQAAKDVHDRGRMIRMVNQNNSSCLAIRHPDVRKFWCKALHFETVSWPCFWNALLSWFTPHVDTVAAKILLSDCQLRKICQQRICQGIGEHVDVRSVDEAFPPHVPVMQRLECWVTSAAPASQVRPSHGGTSLSPCPTSLHLFESPPEFLHSSRHLCDVCLEQTSAKLCVMAVKKLQIYLSDLHNREHFFKESTSVRHGELLGAHLRETSDGRLSLEPASATFTSGEGNYQQCSVDATRSCALSLLSKTLLKLHQVIADVKSRLINVIGVSGQSNTLRHHRQVICITGPAMSGKTRFASLLANAVHTKALNMQNGSQCPTCAHHLDMAGIFHLEQAIDKLSMAFTCTSYKRDLQQPFEFIHEGGMPRMPCVLVLDQVDALPTNHLIDFVRLILYASPSTKLLITSRVMKLNSSQLVCQEVLQPWSKVFLSNGST